MVGRRGKPPRVAAQLRLTRAPSGRQPVRPTAILRRMSLAPRRILIVKPSSLGDIVHALAVLAELRRAYPSAHVAWLVSDGFAPLLEGHPLLDEVLTFDRARYGRMWRSPRVLLDFWRFVAAVRRRRFDLVIDLQGLARSGLLSYLSGARERCGFADAREGAWLFYTRRVASAAHTAHAVDRNLALLRALGLPSERPQFPLAVRPEERAAARSLLTRAAGEAVGPFTAVIPGARWETKRWPAERFAELIDRMHAAGLPRCVLLGAPADRAAAAAVAAACHRRPIDLVGLTTLRELVALLELADRVVGHDSGPLHIAAALGKPIVALFGPTNPARTGPYCDSATVVTCAVPCAPCYRRVCPYGHHDCLRRLEVETVLAAITNTGRVRTGS